MQACVTSFHTLMHRRTRCSKLLLPALERKQSICMRFPKRWIPGIVVSLADHQIPECHQLDISRSTMSSFIFHVCLKRWWLYLSTTPCLLLFKYIFEPLASLFIPVLLVIQIKTATRSFPYLFLHSGCSLSLKLSQLKSLIMCLWNLVFLSHCKYKFSLIF